MDRQDTDHTKVQLQTNVKASLDPTIIRMQGTATHGNTPFDVPFISQIDGNLWQGGCQNGLQLPHFFKHIVSLYPWESYTVKHDMNSYVSVKMYDSLDQAFAQVDALAKWINVCKAQAPILVHCQAGLNRSSLVVARSLMFDGYTAQQAIDMLRDKRSPACLCNKSFEAWLYFSEQIDKAGDKK